MVLLSPTTESSPSIRTTVILLSAPPTLTEAQLPLTVRVLFEPPMLSDLPSAQSISVVVPKEP